jgi:hypothetical protein
MVAAQHEVFENLQDFLRKESMESSRLGFVFDWPPPKPLTRRRLMNIAARRIFRIAGVCGG